MASHFAWTSGNWKCKRRGASIKKYVLFQRIDKIMFQYKNQEQNILINYLTPETRGPRAFYRSPDNQQQTVQSDKRQPEWQIPINACVVGNTSMLLWTFGLKDDFLKGEALPLPSSTYFCPILDLPLGISGRNHYQNGSIPSKAFCLWSSLWILLALPWIHPRADLIKSLKHVRAMRTSSLKVS